MARPSPVPSICLFLFSSNRENESKRCEIFSDLMPMPVSDIVKVIIIFFAGQKYLEQEILASAVKG